MVTKAEHMHSYILLLIAAFVLLVLIFSFVFQMGESEEMQEEEGVEAPVAAEAGQNTMEASGQVVVGVSEGETS